MNAYWSEEDKSCVIPKPTGYVSITSVDSTTASTLISSGVAHVNPLFCLSGDFHWQLTFEAKTVTFTAAATGFQTPSFKWRFLDAVGGQYELPDGFTGSVQINTSTSYEDVHGISINNRLYNVDTAVRGNKLTIKNNSPINLFNFAIRVEVVAAEGAFTASQQVRREVHSEVLAFEDSYYSALKACQDLLQSLIHQAQRKVIPFGPGDPAPWTWIRDSSLWATSEKSLLVARAASMAAAVQNRDTELAHKLRATAALVGSVPVEKLMPIQIKRGVRSRTAR